MPFLLVSAWNLEIIMNVNHIVQPATKDGGFFHFIRGWVVMFNVSERPYRYHADFRFSLIADLQLSKPVRFVPEADVGK
ncbi:hypothetical protein C1N59_18395 [Pantoea sp. SGAir0183]